ncbi:TPA: hypothetical protein LA462_003140 [Clostridium botulinum]|nr:hypothetical protein [Clostridium botulinum]
MHDIFKVRLETVVSVLKDTLQIVMSLLTIITLSKNLMPKKKKTKNKKRFPKGKRK